MGKQKISGKDALKHVGFVVGLAATLMVFGAHDASAAVLDEFVSEFQSWEVAFDGGFAPLAITGGVLATLVAAIFSFRGALGTFVVVTLGALAYGAREILKGLAV